MVWGGAPPATALNTLQSHISDLRGLLGDRNAMVARPPGYLLDLGEEATDVQVAGRLVEAAARADDPGVRAARLAEALSLWRDRPLADIAALPAFDREAERLTAMWLDATQSLVEARLALGQHTDLVARLRELTGRYPHHEPFARQLMLALYRSGRQADALAAFHRLRSSLAGELGIEPGREVREVQAAILRHDSALDGSAGPLPPGPVPRQLPAAVPGFTGRVGYLADLDAHLDLVRDSPTVVISVLSGTAGVGKTT